MNTTISWEGGSTSLDPTIPQNSQSPPLGGQGGPQPQRLERGAASRSFFQWGRRSRGVVSPPCGVHGGRLPSRRPSPFLLLQSLHQLCRRQSLEWLMWLAVSRRLQRPTRAQVAPTWRMLRPILGLHRLRMPTGAHPPSPRRQCPDQGLRPVSSSPRRRDAPRRVTSRRQPTSRLSPPPGFRGRPRASRSPPRPPEVACGLLCRLWVAARLAAPPRASGHPLKG